MSHMGVSEAEARWMELLDRYGAPEAFLGKIPKGVDGRNKRALVTLEELGIGYLMGGLRDNAAVHARAFSGIAQRIDMDG